MSVIPATNLSAEATSPTLLEQLKRSYNTRLICITPFRDERWILHRFLSCALLWADHVILGDNNSIEPYDDILEKHDQERVTIIRNDMKVFNESELRQPLLEAARKIPGRKVLLFLDADEVISGNILDSPELHSLFSAPEGTVFTTNWYQLRETVQDGFIGHTYLIPFFLDDDLSAYNMSSQFHGYRIPGEERLTRWNIIKLNDINVIHYAQVDPLKMKIKIMWYQVQELLQQRGKPIMEILRQYFSNDLMKPTGPVGPIPDRYFDNYLKAGIDMTSVSRPYFIWQEKMVIELLKKYGPKHFDVLDIWDHNWTSAAAKYDIDSTVLRKHKRSFKGRLLRSYIRRTQEYSGGKLIQYLDRVLDKIL